MAEERPASVPRGDCVARLDELWFCFSPVYQLSQYYKFGELDSCNQKWSELWKCLRSKARGTPMEDHLPATSVLWEMRTKEEAREFWEKQFGHLKKTQEAKKGDGKTI
mmetsp:Transcript_5990/g.37159  ORF Transcript_5990/g.37159 Transcript_5990/m.37159 type:complete len:108 (+) Transcript_5990:1784-2107(+)